MLAAERGGYDAGDVLTRAPVGLLVLDAQRRIVSANRRAAAVLGLPAAELVGRSLVALVAGADQADLRAHLGGDGEEPIDVRVGDGGEPRWVTVTSEAPGERQVVVLADITPRKRFERWLADNSDRLEAFLDASASLAAWMKDADGRHVYVNDAHASALGVPKPSVLGKTSFELVPRDEALRAEETDQAVLRSGGSRVATEERLSTDGACTWQTVRFLFWDAAGARFTGGVGVDVTAQRRAEGALRETQEQLRQAQKMETIGRLAGGVAHDFNNLLTVVLSYAGMLASDLSLPPLARDLAEEIRGAGERAAQLTRQLLSFSRRRLLEPVVIDPSQLVRGLRAMLQPMLREDIELTLDLDPDAGLVVADRGSLEQVVMNLVVNARDAMPGGGALTIGTRRVVLGEADARAHAGAKAGPHVALFVRDTGAGVDADLRARIFEPFFTTKPAGQGTGLGLSIVLGIVEQSGGVVTLESAPGEGACFRVALPQVDAEAAARLLPRPGSVSPRGTETVLVVDDDDRTREVVRRGLADAGYDVLVAEGPNDALARAHAEPARPIHLLVTDVVMPKMSGVDLAARLTEARPGLKVLYLTGYASENLSRLGAAILPKPFTPPSLAAHVRRVLDG